MSNERLIPYGMLLNLLVGATLAASCGSDKHRTDSAVSIYGGESSRDGEWSSAVALLQSGSTFCTGTVVHPKLVITAAHCVTNLQTESGSQVRILVGQSERTGKSYAVERIKYYPGYRDNTVTDIAYLRLKEPVKGIEIVPVLSSEQEISSLLVKGASVTLAGFGFTNNRQIGIKHNVTTTITSNSNSGLYIGGGGKDTCQGDSGGPAFGKLANAEWRVFGITSRGTECGKGGSYARMHDQICWIQKDSGITIPGIQKSCADVTPINVRTPRQIYLGIGESDKTPVLAIAAGAEIKETAICKGDVDTCRRSLKKDMSFARSKNLAQDTVIFTNPASPEDLPNNVFTLLGFDEYGNLLASNPVQLFKK